MLSEEILVRMGLDAAPLAAGMRTMRSRVASAVEPIKNLFASMLAPLSAGGLFIAFKNLSDSVDRIKRIAESADISTGLTQDFLNIGKSAGIAGDQIEAAIGIFSKKLAPGDDAEKKLMALADRLAEMEDPGERARLVIENFGKAGIKMLPILEQGAEGVKKLGKEFGKLGDSQIELIDRADEEIDKFKNKLKIGFAGVLFFSSALLDYFKELRANGGDGKGFAGFMDRKAAVEARAAVARDHARRAAQLAAAAHEKQLNLRERLAKDAEQQRKAELDDNEKLNKQIEHRNRLVRAIIDAMGDRMTAQKNLTEGFRDRASSSLEELASSGHWEVSRWKRNRRHWVADSPYAGDAQEVLDLEARAKQARAAGNPQLTYDLTRKALDLRETIPALSSGEQNPLASLREAAKETASTTAELLKLAQGDKGGVVIQVPN